MVVSLYANHDEALNRASWFLHPLGLEQSQHNRMAISVEQSIFISLQVANLVDRCLRAGQTG
jgi:hypothetical protein